MVTVNRVLLLFAFLVGAPLLGGLLMGIDRKISARLQGRFGPPILQPFYDVGKLFLKQTLVVRRSQNMFIVFFLVFVIVTGAIFFVGGDLLLVIFALTLAGIFFVLAGYKSSSPYSFIGAQRELLQMLAYEPMIILAAIGMYMVTKSFSVAAIIAHPTALITTLPGIFLGFLYILTIKFRKSPFDLSLSHHAHQEIVRGIATEFSGPTLALIEIAHWYENVILLGFIYLFFANDPILAALAAALVYFLEIIIDNTFARAKWQLMVKSSWIVTLVLGMGNLLILSFVR
ncbi:MAG: NADH-quinone oxidoreductase subunit H [Chitinivibrionales bacterium]|nr:NADH-quinone oxidoreductase subunit H [Chitinivibrionales bacterium]